jgi:hypothetical protein
MSFLFTAPAFNQLKWLLLVLHLIVATILYHNGGAICLLHLYDAYKYWLFMPLWLHFSSAFL